ncbi:hypothetical protein OQA88_10447 [Cercophora sp. LCS_1]
MHIKQIIIQGFKSYKDQTIIEPFSPGTNVIVGRNGSGKSNFFAAIRFVLSDAYVNMSREERQGLLHEGSGSAVMSAYVEIIFDNTDKRFSEPGDEVVIRRTIGLKKDEYSVDKKVQTRADVLKILETAGFAKENPFYIVPQGRITAITNMKESERLNLLKEIAGTNTYDDRRIQSLKIMAETNNKREKIDELLTYIEERLKELEEEKNDLREYQDKDRERRCLEYAHWHHLQEVNAEKLQQLEEARQDGAGATSKESILLQRTEKEIAVLEQKYLEITQELEVLDIERRQLDGDRKEAARARAKAEMKVDNLNSTRQTQEQQKQKHDAALRDVRQKIKVAEADLAKISPEYEKWKAEEAQIKTQRELAKAGSDRIQTKRVRKDQFKTKAERDNYLKTQINEISSQLGTQRANEHEVKEQVAQLQASIEQLEQVMQEKREQIGGAGEKRDELIRELRKARDVLDQLEDDKKKLSRESEKLDALLDRSRKEKEIATRELSRSMDAATAKGLQAIERLKREKNLPGAYGILAELMTVPIEGYRLPVEITASKSLFHYVVDNDNTASILTDYLEKNQAGRITFIPLAQVRPRQVKMPRAPDAVPLISKIEYDPKFEKALQLVFGRTIVCPNLSVASQFARTHGLDAITSEGETVNKRGALTGGFINTRQSRLAAVQRLEQVREVYEQQLADMEKMRKETEILGQKRNMALSEVYKLEQQMERFTQSVSRLDGELQTKNFQLQRERDSLERAIRTLATVEENLRTFDAQLSSYNDELQSDFKNGLSASEERQLEEFVKQQDELTKKLKKVSEKRLDLEGRKRSLEEMLQTQLRPHEIQLQSQAFENSSGGASGSLSDAERELKKAEKSAAAIEALLQENEQKIAEVTAERAQLDAQKAQKEGELQELQRRIDHAQKRMEKNNQKKARYTIQAAEYAKNIRDLGILPEEAFGKYERMKLEQIETRLRKCNEALKKFGHINKKAFDQYTGFTTQRDHLLKRRDELDQSQNAIENLVDHLDHAKDEAIERTFKQVSKEFATIFEQLVPAGHGRLVIQRKADKGKGRNAQAESDDDQPASVENYTGVGISVSFNSKVMDEQQKIQQLSGGQKSLCALCLIFALQAAESSPFVIFDEVDANLDAQYRTAVASLLDSISKTQKTQFICTTFRPEIVLVADKCYGVTFHNKNSTIDCVPTEDALNFVEGQRK